MIVERPRHDFEGPFIKFVAVEPKPRVTDVDAVQVGLGIEYIDKRVIRGTRPPPRLHFDVIEIHAVARGIGAAIEESVPGVEEPWRERADSSSSSE